MTDIERFLESQQPSAPEDSGAFTLDQESMLKKYESLLPDYRMGLLFFFQAAERWGATLIDVKVRHSIIEIGIHLPAESASVLVELRDSPEIIEQLLPFSHRLYELGHGYKILSRGNKKTKQTFQVNELESTLLIKHHDEISLSRLADMDTCRFFFRFDLVTRIWIQTRILIDTVPHPKTQKDFVARLYRALGMRRKGDRVDPKVVAHFWSPNKNSLFQEAPLRRTPLPVTDSKMPIFQFAHDYEHHELIFILDDSGTNFVPVRHGIAMPAIRQEMHFGNCILAFQADHLETDLSGLKLLENDAYFKAVEECKAITVEALKGLYEIQSYYLPTMDRGQLLMNAGLWTIGAPLLGGLFLGGPGVIYGAKSILTKVFYGATAAGGFHRFAQHVPNPGTYTQAMRKEHLGWLDDERLLETMAKYGVDIEPPKISTKKANANGHQEDS